MLFEIASLPPKDALDNATNTANPPEDIEDANTEVEMVQEYVIKVNNHQTVGGDKFHDNDSNTVLALRCCLAL